MIFTWERQDDRLLRFMRIPAKRKLEWLYQMNEFLRKASTKKQSDIRRRLRETS